MKRFLYLAIVCEFCCGSVLGSLATLPSFAKTTSQEKDKVQQIYDINLKEFFKAEVYKQKYPINCDCIALIVEQLIECGDIAIAAPGKDYVALHGSAVAVLKDELYKLINCTSFQIVADKVKLEFDIAFSVCKDVPVQDRCFEYLLFKKNATFGEIIEECFAQISLHLGVVDYNFFSLFGELDIIEKWLVDSVFVPSDEIFSRLAASAESVIGREKFSKDDFFRKISDIAKKSFGATFNMSKTKDILDFYRKNISSIFSGILLNDDLLKRVVIEPVFLKTGGLLGDAAFSQYTEKVFLWLGKRVVYDVINGNGGKNLASDYLLEESILRCVNSFDICCCDLDIIAVRKLISSLIDAKNIHTNMPDESKLKGIILDWSENLLSSSWWGEEFVGAQKYMILELKELVCNWNEWVDENKDWIYKSDFEKFMQLWANKDNVNVRLMDKTKEYDLGKDKAKYIELWSTVGMLCFKLNELSFGLMSLFVNWINSQKTLTNEMDETKSKVLTHHKIMSSVMRDFLTEQYVNVDKDGVVEKIFVKTILDQIRGRLSALYEEQNKLYEEDLKNESGSVPKSWRGIYELFVKYAWNSIKEEVLEINNNACATKK